MSESEILDRLLKQGKVSLDEVERARSRQHSDNGSSVRSIFDYLDEECQFSGTEWTTTLGEAHAPLSSISLSASRDAVECIPFRLAEHYSIVPLTIDGDSLHCATSNPFDIARLREIQTLCGMSIVFSWALHKDIVSAQMLAYGIGAKYSTRVESDSTSSTLTPRSNGTGSAIDVVDDLLADAHLKRATDIHLEPTSDGARVRYRIDGILYTQSISEYLHASFEAAVSRLKVLANLDLAERRRPQDGRIRATIGGSAIDVRISILPTQFGETVDIRLLGEEQLNLDLARLGLVDEDLVVIKQAMSIQNGIILVTGPTGSGKTTTLYSCLKYINSDERKIITIEDPIEYNLEGVTQLQVHSKVSFTFANGLRSMLRHDPDIMMVGEVRDPETARIGVQVALTGHLVLSTLHTNDAISSIARLRDMGVEKYLLGSTLRLIMAQRLVRKICPRCKTTDDVSSLQLGTETYIGRGCEQCNDTGYRGRTGIFEILSLNDRLFQMISEGSDTQRLKVEATNAGMISLRQKCLDRVSDGTTSYGEMLRVVGELD